MKKLLTIALMTLALTAIAGQAHAQTPTPTPTPYPMPTPYPAGALGPHGFLLTDTATQLGNCQSFPRITAGAVIYRVSGTSTSGTAEFIQLYDQATYGPSSPEVWPALSVPSGSGSWTIDLSPGLAVHNGLLVCSSLNADPTQYTPAALSDQFGVAWRP